MKKTTQEEQQAFLILIENATNIAIFGHESIDGDAIGSILSMQRMLQKIGKKADCFTPDPLDPSYFFLDGAEQIKTEFEHGIYDLHIFLDFTPRNRIRKFTTDHMDYFLSIPTIVIDHHLGDNHEATLSIKDTGASSNCERLLELYQEIRPEHIDPYVATYLYLGLVMDTGNFYYESDSQRSFGHAKALIEAGADKKSIISNIFRSRSFNTMKFVQVILERLSVYQEKILYSYYSKKELESFKLGTNDVDYALHLIQNIGGYHLTCMFKIHEDCIKCSLRSRAPHESPDGKSVHVGNLAKNFNGGGHTYAAGCRQERDTNIEANEQIEQMLKQMHQKC